MIKILRIIKIRLVQLLAYHNRYVRLILGNYSAKNGYVNNYIEFVAKSFLTTFYIVLGYGCTFYLIDYKMSSLLLIATALLIMGCLFLFQTSLELTTISNTYLLICTSSLIGLVLFSGGIASPVLPWLICIPFIANIIVRTLGVWIWTTLIISVISTLSYLNLYNIHLTNLLDQNPNSILLFLLLNVGLVLTLILFTYTNWQYRYKKEKKTLIKKVQYITQDEMDYFAVNWNFMKDKFQLKYRHIIRIIDNYFFLTEHEKKYVFIDYLKLDPDELAESMNVSKRTIETNFYRVRKKLKVNKIDYRSLKELEGN